MFKYSDRLFMMRGLKFLCGMQRPVNALRMQTIAADPDRHPFPMGKAVGDEIRARQKVGEQVSGQKSGDRRK